MLIIIDKNAVYFYYNKHNKMIGDCKMKNILTPEEENMPVTYKNLTVIMDKLLETLKANDKNMQNDIVKTFDRIFDELIKIRNDAEYKRQRDFRYMIGTIAQIARVDKEDIYNNYKNWCEEFDKLNKPKVNSEDINE